MKLEKVRVGTWNQFLTRNLSIEPRLVGNQHEFLSGAYRICVAIPSTKHIGTQPGRGTRLWFDHYTKIGGKTKPLQLWVESVDVIVKGADEVSLAAEVLRRAPNQTELIPKAQQEKLSRLVVEIGAIAERSFDLWLRTLRWKSWNSSFGRPEISGHEGGWPTCLIAQPNMERIWIGPIIFQAKGSKLVTSAIWGDVALALETGCQPPLFVDLLMDSIEHVKSGELQRGIVETAMGCEVFLRTLVAGSLSSCLQPSISKYVDDANIRTVLDNWCQGFLPLIS